MYRVSCALDRSLFIMRLSRYRDLFICVQKGRPLSYERHKYTEETRKPKGAYRIVFHFK